MYEKATLSNGVRVVFDVIPTVRSVAFGIWVGNGSRNESPELNGISHFMEHMMFKGTQKRTAKDIADQIDSVGGQLNAATSKESTYYYVRILDNHFELALDVLCDMFFNSKFDEEEIKKERNVILEEISMYEDSPEDVVHDLMHSSIWKNDPLGRSILGTEETIGTFNHDTLRKYYKRNYIPQNIVISIAGNFDQQEVLKKIEKYFDEFQSDYDAPEKYTINDYNKILAVKDKDIEQVHLLLSFPSIARGTDDSYVVSVMDLILGGGMSSRLFQRIREEQGLCYSIYSNNVSYRDRGLFSIYVGLNPTHVDTATKLILDEVEKFKNFAVTSEQLEKAKEQLKSNYILSMESSSNRMSRIGNSELLLNRVLTPDEIIQKIDDVNLERFKALGTKILNTENLSIAAVGKVNGLNFDKFI